MYYYEIEKIDKESLDDESKLNEEIEKLEKEKAILIRILLKERKERETQYSYYTTFSNEVKRLYTCVESKRSYIDGYQRDRMIRKSLEKNEKSFRKCKKPLDKMPVECGKFMSPASKSGKRTLFDEQFEAAMVEIMELKVSIQEYQNQNKDLNRKITELKSVLRANKKLIDEQQGHLRALKIQHTELDGIHRDNIRKTESLKEEHRKNDIEIKFWNQRYEKAYNTLAISQDRFLSTSEELERMKRSYKESKRKSINLATKLIDLKASIENINTLRQEFSVKKINRIHKNLDCKLTLYKDRITKELFLEIDNGKESNKIPFIHVSHAEHIVDKPRRFRIFLQEKIKKKPLLFESAQTKSIIKTFEMFDAMRAKRELKNISQAE